MKLLKLIVVAIIPLFSLCLPSCGNDDENNIKDGSSIVGTWIGTASYDYNDKESFEYVFKKDGTFSSKWWSGAISDYDKDDFGILYGSYSYDDNLNVLRMEVVDEDGDTYSDYFYCKVSKNSMIWRSEDLGGEVILTRK